MKLELLTIAMALTGALAYVSHGNSVIGRGWGGGLVVSRRDAEAEAPAAAAAADDDDDDNDETPTVAELSALVETLLTSAKKGMTLDEMGAAAVLIQQAADKIVDAQGGEVETSDVQKAIDDAAASFSGVVAVSSLFDEPLTYEANKMDSAMCLLNTLNTKAKEQEAAGESSQATVAAISMTTQAMQNIMTDTVGIIAFTYDLEKQKDVTKRWEVHAGANKDQFGRWGYNVGVEHSWNGRRKRSAASRTKRGRWSGGVGVSRSPGGGIGFSGHISYSWGR